MTQPTPSIAKSRLPTALTALILAFGLVACGGASPNAGDDNATDPDPTSTQAPEETQADDTNDGSGATGAFQAQIEIGDGDFAGSHTLDGGVVECGIYGDASSLSYLDNMAADGLFSVSFTAQNGGSNPPLFNLALGFREGGSVILDTGTMLTTDDPGEGTAQLTDNGDSIRWEISGTTGEGVAVDATIDCADVTRT